MKNPMIQCILCEDDAEYTLKPDGGRVLFLCTKHFKETVKKLQELGE